jgi:exopolysaccharide biosynthesis polyprenyl glycosylphosphotransferase
MLNKSTRLHVQIERLVDALIGLVALSLATLIRREVSRIYPGWLPIFDFWPQAGWLYILLVALWLFLYDRFHLYARRAVHTPGQTVGLLLRISLVGIVAAFFLLYLLQLNRIPRVLIIFYAGVSFVLMVAKEYVLWYLAPRWGPAPPTLLLVGAPDDFREFIGRARSSGRWRPHVAGILAMEGAPVAPAAESEPVDAPVLGTTRDLVGWLHERSVDCVVLSPGAERFEDIQRVIHLCETEGVEVWLMGSLFKTRIARAQVDEFQDLPMLIFSTTPPDPWALLFKRAIDLVGSLVLLALFLPLMLLVAAAIKLTSPGPVLFRQRRCTLHGREFWMYKFRTMVNEAEQLRLELETRNEVAGPVFKMRNDPRITRIGRFLRRYSLDELPQLFNVLRGDMSLVGPRPPIPAEVRQYQDWQRRRLSMRPGLTCIWQTAGRNAVSFEDWMKLDLQYIDNWSLGLDMRILLKTPQAMLRGTGV